MSNLSGFRGRSGPTPSGRYENVPDLATDKQINYLNDLRVERGADPLALGAARHLTKDEARREIQSWKDIPVDPDAPPAGRDTDLWHLALLFRQGAQDADIELAKSLPVIYGEIDDLVTRYGIRRQTFHHEVHGCKRRELPYFLANRCWYHYPPTATSGHAASVITWVQMVEIIIAEFWSRIQDEHALDQFRQTFAEYGRAAVKHWNSLRVIKDIDSTPRAAPPPMRRRESSGTMTRATKEVNRGSWPGAGRLRAAGEGTEAVPGERPDAGVLN
jgi:hypothetical protein